MTTTQEQLQAALPQARAEDVAKYADVLASTCSEFSIDTVNRFAGFLSQIGVESEYLREIEENLNYSAEGLLRVFETHFTAENVNDYARQPEKIANRVYANRMGNGDEASGDGWKYRGRGLIDITGKDEYIKCLTALGLDPDNPDALLDPVNAARSAGWFWQQRNINEAADTGDIVRMTKLVNGGLNGLDTRKEIFERALTVLNSDN